MAEALVVVQTRPGGYFAAVCSAHGAITLWDSPAMAAWDALGHATTHHR